MPAPRQGRHCSAAQVGIMGIQRLSATGRLLSTAYMHWFEYLGQWQLPLHSLLLSLCLCEAVLVQQQQVHRPVLADKGYLCAHVRAVGHVSNAGRGLG